MLPKHGVLQAMYANINDGYVEALVRGYRAGLLTAADYNNLSQCDNLDDVKLHLVRAELCCNGRPWAHRTVCSGD